MPLQALYILGTAIVYSNSANCSKGHCGCACGCVGVRVWVCGCVCVWVWGGGCDQGGRVEYKLSLVLACTKEHQCYVCMLNYVYIACIQDKKAICQVVPHHLIQVIKL